jgi:hypothetical protein
MHSGKQTGRSAKDAKDHVLPIYLGDNPNQAAHSFKTQRYEQIVGAKAGIPGLIRPVTPKLKVLLLTATTAYYNYSHRRRWVTTEVTADARCLTQLLIGLLVLSKVTFFQRLVPF